MVVANIVIVVLLTWSRLSRKFNLAGSHGSHDITSNFFKHCDNRLASILQNSGIEYLTSVVAYIVHLGYCTEVGFCPCLFGPFIQILPSLAVDCLQMGHMAFKLSNSSGFCTLPHNSFKFLAFPLLCKIFPKMQDTKSMRCTRHDFL